MRPRPSKQVGFVTIIGFVASAFVAPGLLGATTAEDIPDPISAIARVRASTRAVNGRFRSRIRVDGSYLVALSEGGSRSQASTLAPVTQRPSPSSTSTLVALPTDGQNVSSAEATGPGQSTQAVVTEAPVTSVLKATRPNATVTTVAPQTVLTTVAFTTIAVTTIALTTLLPTSTLTGDDEPVRFSAADVRVDEGQSAVIRLTTNRPQDNDVKLHLVVGAGTARVDDYATGRDLTIPSSVVLKAGTTEVRILVPIRNDDIRELDESRFLAVTKSDDPTVLASAKVTIVDDDTKAVRDIRSAGAVGDGQTDDTAAIQRAVDEVHGAGGGVVTFPRGTYIVRSVRIYPGITFIGQGGVLKRPAGQGKWVRTFTTDGAGYFGDVLSAPLVIDGMVFDGNRQQQSEYRHHELEQAHMVMLFAAPDSPGQLQAFVHNTTFRDGVADGLSIYTNVNAVVTQSSAHDVFRGGLVVGGGNTDLVVDSFTTTGAEVPTGIDFEVDGQGYGGTFNVRAKLSNLDIDSDFDIGVGDSDGSTVTVDHLTMRKGPFTSYTPNAKVVIKNSVLHFGGADIGNRILFPYDMTIENSQIIVTPDPAQQFSAVDVWFGHPIAEQPPGVLRFRNVAFVKGPGVSPSYGVYRRVVRPGDQILFENVTFDSTFTKSIGP
jgi:Pectate lyase superfamily protein